MKINLNDLTTKIEQEDYLQDLETVKYGELSKSKAKVTEFAGKMVKEVQAAIKHNSLIHTSLEVTGQRSVTFSLEANIINLPYSNYKKIANFFDEGQDYDINIYFETSSEYINTSKFRIDLLASSSELSDEAELTAKTAAAITTKLKEVREYKKPGKKASKKPAVKKRTAKAKPAARTKKD